MNTLFITYSILFLIAILSIGVLSYYSFINKKIDLKNWFFIGLGWLLFTNFLYLFNKGMDVNEKLSIENIPMEIVSVDDSRNDSIINDTVLYRYLVDIRTNHANIILIQCKIESNNYKSDLFLRNNNLLGMKVSSSRISVSDGSRAGYQKYSSWKQSITDYVMWG